MSETHDQPRELSQGEAAPPTPPVLSVTDRASVGPEAGVSDDTPTIISRPPPRSARAENAFAHGLRGRSLAHFELIEPIGVGGMAAVIRARDTHLDRMVALKILPPEMAADPENIRRFQQEARAAARLDHENIARVFFCGEDQGLHFIAFEFVEGDNLRAILERKGRLSVTDAVHYLLQITLGLAHAAERGVVHRDVKPSNIIITPAGRAKLVDMGLARSLHPLGQEDLTQSGVTLGTFDYISPEQALEPREADVRSDIYSLGCTFYQLLTGQSAVPEGTAAKKLHHHQHVDPLDPRQLNSEIPDDLAAILACMMAKDPKQRYQQPIHLVKHLQLLSRQLGVEADAADPVRHIDVPLPRTPYPMRPALLVAAAAFLVVVLVVFHSMTAPQGPGNLPERASNRGADQPKTGDSRLTSAPASPPLTSKESDSARVEPAEFRKEIRTADQLREALQHKSQKLRLQLAPTIDLSPAEAGDMAERAIGLVVEAGPEREVVIEPKEPDQHAILKLKYDPDYRGDGAVDWTALTVKSGKVTLRNLRLEVDASAGPGVVVTGVKVQGGELALENCELIQYNPPNGDQGRLSSIVVEGPAKGGPRSQVKAWQCYFSREYREELAGGAFRGGQEAVTISGAANVKLTGCALVPHAALIHFRDGATADVSLVDCTVMMNEGVVFQADAEVSSTANVSHTLISRPEVPKSEGTSALGRAVLVQRSGRPPATLAYEGTGNRYHNLSAFAVKDGVTTAATLEEFRQGAPAGGDEAQLEKNPWLSRDPLQKLKINQPQQAFEPDTSLAELRRADKRFLVGTDRCAGWRFYQPPLLPTGEKVVRSKTLVVDPSRGRPDMDRGVYLSLGEAVLHMEPGDEIQLRFNGPRPTGVLNLEKPNLDLTIKPYRGFRPVLTLGETSEAEVNLFRVGEGKLRFEGVEFLLKPRQRDFKETQAIVGLAGAGRCEFEDCTITLDVEGTDAAMAVAALADPSKVMATRSDTPERVRPELLFKKSFIRGKGDLVAVRASRAFSLDAEQCLVALTGSLLSIDGNAKEKEEAAVRLESQVNLKRVTTYLTGNLVLIRAAKTMKDLVVPTLATADDCLFVSGAGEALIHLEGEFSKSQIKNLLSWGGSHNAYSNFTHVLDQQQQGNEMSEPSFGQREWTVDFSRESNAAFDKVKFASISAETALTRAVPEQFKVVRLENDADTDYGPALEDLPKPRQDKPAAAPTSDVR